MTSATLLTYPSQGIDRPAYLARPATEEPRPGVIVIHEIFGLSPHIQDVAQRLGDQGYVALAPDLFAHGGRPVTNEQLESALRLMRSLPPGSRRNPEAAQAKLAEIPAAGPGATPKGPDLAPHPGFGPPPPRQARGGGLPSPPALRSAGTHRLCGILHRRGAVRPIGGGGRTVGGVRNLLWGPATLRADPPHPMPGPRSVRRRGSGDYRRRALVCRGDAEGWQVVRVPRVHWGGARVLQRHATGGLS